jgi:hypothetical protein
MRDPARLVIVSDLSGGQVVTLTGGVTTLGRAATCQLVLEDEFASRRHAQIVLRDDLYWLRDLGSKNGTFVDGRPVIGEILLSDGALIQIGDIRLRFHDPAATATHPSVEPARGAIWVDPAARQVWLRGELLKPPLSPKQFDLMLLLWQRAGEAVSKDEIAAAIWSEEGGEVYDYQVDKLVSRLRDRLRGSAFVATPGDEAAKPVGEIEELIETVWGYGFRLKV